MNGAALLRKKSIGVRRFFFENIGFANIFKEKTTHANRFLRSKAAPFITSNLD
jgi:hypothetical protein